MDDGMKIKMVSKVPKIITPVAIRILYMINSGIHLDKPSLNKGMIKQKKIIADPASGCIIIRNVGIKIIIRIVIKCLLLFFLNKNIL